MALEIDELRVFTLELHDVVDFAHRDDFAVLYADGLGAHRGIIHREDRPAGIDPVGDLLGLR